MRISFSKKAVKAFQSLAPSLQKNIMARIQGLLQIPPIGDIQPMQGYPPGIFRLRVGQYRVVFQYTIENPEKNVYIIDIGPRSDIYK
ncbi:MAG: type II toxin-antitoxin system RelE/ParE family toxin [Oscillospiraceae bacterium]|nr:type II toxin-antitoxin system RelE/ParE family toxin [Oscillospiraceae bacterium]